MPELGPDKTTAVAYPPKSLYDQWCVHADELNQPVSQYLIRMVEAGREQIDLDTVANESMQDLRQQRSDLQSELDRARQRIEELERQLYRTEQSDIVDYIAENPGATTAEIIQHIADTVPNRVASHLDALEGGSIVQREDGFYPEDTGSEEIQQAQEES